MTLKRYQYEFTTHEGIETITVKGKGRKSAIKKFNAPFIKLTYVNKNGNIQQCK